MHHKYAASMTMPQVRPRVTESGQGPGPDPGPCRFESTGHAPGTFSHVLQLWCMLHSYMFSSILNAFRIQEQVSLCKWGHVLRTF